MIRRTAVRKMEEYRGAKAFPIGCWTKTCHPSVGIDAVAVRTLPEEKGSGPTVISACRSAVGDPARRADLTCG